MKINHWMNMILSRRKINIINSELKEICQVVDNTLNIYMETNIIYQKRVIESMKYSLFTGGKRLRPIIAMKVFEIFNNEIDIILPYAAALEMIHTYSLVHDDLPSMDNDEFRRGKLTNHMVFGEAMAILTGDALLNYAFEIMSKDMYENSSTLEEYKSKSRVIWEIGNYSGTRGMIGGQVVDLFSGHDDMNQDKLLFMYKAKTAALFQASVVTGAILGGANEEEIEILREFALCLGMAYQIQDDLLDIKEDAEIRKLTYLTYFEKEKAWEDMMKYSKRAIELLETLKDRNTSFLKDLTNILVNRKK